MMMGWPKIPKRPGFGGAVIGFVFGERVCIFAIQTLLGIHKGPLNKGVFLGLGF